MLRRNGYKICEIILDASKCGVPQRRKRLFAIGDREGSSSYLKKQLMEDMADKSMTLRDYFSDSLGLEHYYRHPRSYKRRGVFSIDEPSPTIRGVNRPVPKGYPGHKGDTAVISEKIRPLSTKERSLIQTFPLKFNVEGKKSETEQIIGNAVPVKLAEFVAQRLMNIIRLYNACDA